MDTQHDSTARMLAFADAVEEAVRDHRPLTKEESALLPSAQDAPAIRAGQRVICDGMGYIVEGLLIEDVDDSADLLVIREDDGTVLEVRGDLCDQITVDGVDLL